MPHSDDDLPLARGLRISGEFLLLAMATLSVWPYASVEPAKQFVLAIGIALLVALWAVHTVITRSLTLRADAVSIGLGGLVLWSLIQLLPLPEPIVGVLSPLRLDWHRTLMPNVMEAGPGEAAVPRSSTVTPTVYPSATLAFVGDLTAVLVVYLVARNWLATRPALRRFAWACAINGLLLAFLALAQFFTSPTSQVYWSLANHKAAVFGPFICRNHYPDYANFCLGLAIGLVACQLAQTRIDPKDKAKGKRFWDKLSDAVRRLLESPAAFGLAIASAVMMVSIPFSMSRAGLLASLAAGAAAWMIARMGREKGRTTLSPVAAAVVGAVLLAGWFGWDQLEKRLKTVVTGQAVESRLPLWRGAIKLIPGTWVGGTGAGTFRFVEPSVRVDLPADLNANSAHNEYLEALIEGGVIRLALTGLLVIGPLVVIGRGYLRMRRETVAPLLLGIWYGLAALVVHSAADFGIHNPSVAVLAAIAAGYAMAVSSDPTQTRQKVRLRKRVRKSSSGEGDGPSVLSTPTPAPTANVLTLPVVKTQLETEHVPGESRVLRGPAAVSVAVVMVLATATAALDFRTRAVAERFRVSSQIIADQGGRPETQANYQAVRVGARPTDAEALAAFAEASFQAARLQTAEAAAAVVGVGAFGLPVEQFPTQIAEQYVVPGLRAARAARAACPVYALPHYQIGEYGEDHLQGEAAGIHFQRALRMHSVEPFCWYRIGQDAFDKGDYESAWTNWRESLTRSDLYLPKIVRAARVKLDSAGLRDRLLPDNPVALLAVADLLYPDSNRQLEARRPFLEKAADLGENPALGKNPDKRDAEIAQLIAAAAAWEGLRNAAKCQDTWERAVELTRTDNARDRVAYNRHVETRNSYTRWLEREERYTDAVKHLEWLLTRAPNRRAIQDRLDGAKHGIELNQVITAAEPKK